MQHDIHVLAFRKQEKFTVTGGFLETLMKHSHENGRKEGFAAGQLEKRSLEFGDDYSSQSAVYLIRAKSRRALSAEVRKRNGRDDFNSAYDCTGRVFAWSCDLLRAYREGSEWVGVCVGTSYRDV